MLHGHVVDELLDQHGLAHAGAAEQADLAPLGIGLQQVDDLDARLQNLHSGALLLKGGGGAIDAAAGHVVGHGGAAVDRLAQHVEHTAQGGRAHGDLDRVAGGLYLHPPGQALAAGKHHAADGAVPHVLGHLHHPDSPVLLYGKGLTDVGQVPRLKLHVHHGT